jgi:hypothetical protein
VHLPEHGARSLPSPPHRTRVGGQRRFQDRLAADRAGRGTPRPPRLRQDRRAGRLTPVPGRAPDRHGGHQRTARRRGTAGPGKMQRLHRRRGQNRSRSFHRLRLGEPRVPRPGRRGSGAGAGRHRSRAGRPEALPHVSALGGQRPRTGLPPLPESGRSGHPGDDPPGRVHPHRRQTGTGPPGAAGRRRAGVPRSARHHRALRDSLGAGGPLPADQAPALLRRAVVPDRHADPA